MLVRKYSHYKELKDARNTQTALENKSLATKNAALQKQALQREKVVSQLQNKRDALEASVERLDETVGSPLPHLHRDWARPCHTWTGLGAPLPHLHRDWAHPCHICTETGLTPATSALGLGSSLPHLHWDWAHPCHSCTGTCPTCGGST
jgi:hypothetical protein